MKIVKLIFLCFLPFLCFAQDEIILRGTIRERIESNRPFEDIIQNIQSPTIFTVKGLKGEIFANGEFKIALPKNEYKGGDEIEVYVTSNNYHQRELFKHTIRNNQFENENLRIFMEKNDAYPYIITGIIKDERTNEPVSGVIVFSLELNQPTISDDKGRYEIRLSLGNNSLDRVTLIFRHSSYEYNKELIVPLQGIKIISINTNATLTPKGFVKPKIEIKKDDPSDEFLQLNSTYNSKRKIIVRSGPNYIENNIRYTMPAKTKYTILYISDETDRVFIDEMNNFTTDRWYKIRYTINNTSFEGFVFGYYLQ